MMFKYYIIEANNLFRLILKVESPNPLVHPWVLFATIAIIYSSRDLNYLGHKRKSSRCTLKSFIIPKSCINCKPERYYGENFMRGRIIVKSGLISGETVKRIFPGVEMVYKELRGKL